MLLYGTSFSAYCAKVRIALRIKGIDFREVPPPGGYRSAEYRALVPTGTIPALDIGGRILFESDAIVEYLDEAWPEPPLLPTTPEARAVARACARYHDTRVEPILRPLFPLIGPAHPDPGPFEQAAALFAERLERLSEIVRPDPFLGGRTISVGDLGYPGTLMMAEWLFAEGGAALALPDGFTAWRRRLLEIEAVAHTVREMTVGLEAWIDGRKRAARA